ncbi:MAG TPA: T9SS type A sorting domain-containing protein, partial [Bacteroidetes bacterium]|nr:T9SS type A sorting domain-containing protein [Bacteroidota bacterium]
MNFTKNANIIFDISGNPYLTVKFKVMPGAMYDSVAVDSVPFLISPWGQDSTGTLVREVDSPVFWAPADGEWHEYTYDFGAKVGVPMWNGVIPPGEFDAIEAILIESVTYPGTYDFTYYMDDFRLGDASAPLNQHKEIPFVAGKFWAQFKVTATDSPMNGAVGMSKTAVENWSDLGPIVRFNTDGFIDVRNGAFYDADMSYPYTAGTEYIVELIGDVATQTYSVNVETGGVKTVIATDYAFRNDNPQDTLNYLDMKVYDKPDFGGVPGSTLKASFMKDDYVLGWNNTIMKDLAMSGTYNVKATLTPSADLINAGFALSKDDPALLGWGDLSPIIRFNNAGFIDVRDGGAYNADVELAYSAGKAYNFDIDIDVPNQKYTVKVTLENGTEKLLASDYGFRKEADTLNYITKLQLNGGPWGGAIGDLLVSNVEVNSTKVQDLNLNQFSIYPNPVNDEITLVAEDNIQKIEILDILGNKQITNFTNDVSIQKINVSSLISGTYIVNIYTE